MESGTRNNEEPQNNSTGSRGESTGQVTNIAQAAMMAGSENIGKSYGLEARNKAFESLQRAQDADIKGLKLDYARKYRDYNSDQDKNSGESSEDRRSEIIKQIDDLAERADQFRDAAARLAEEAKEAMLVAQRFAEEAKQIYDQTNPNIRHKTPRERLGEEFEAYNKSRGRSRKDTVVESQMLPEIDSISKAEKMADSESGAKTEAMELRDQAIEFLQKAQSAEIEARRLRFYALKHPDLDSDQDKNSDESSEDRRSEINGIQNRIKDLESDAVRYRNQAGRLSKQAEDMLFAAQRSAEEAGRVYDQTNPNIQHKTSREQLKADFEAYEARKSSRHNENDSD